MNDTGIGIKEEDLECLFKVFGFLETTKEINTGGIGLGLAISKLIVNNLDGEIICKSKW